MTKEQLKEQIEAMLNWLSPGSAPWRKEEVNTKILALIDNYTEEAVVAARIDELEDIINAYYDNTGYDWAGGRFMPVTKAEFPAAYVNSRLKKLKATTSKVD